MYVLRAEDIGVGPNCEGPAELFGFCCVGACIKGADANSIHAKKRCW